MHIDRCGRSHISTVIFLRANNKYVFGLPLIIQTLSRVQISGNWIYRKLIKRSLLDVVCDPFLRVGIECLELHNIAN